MVHISFNDGFRRLEFLVSGYELRLGLRVRREWVPDVGVDAGCFILDVFPFVS